MRIKNRFARYARKMEIYKSCVNGSFDTLDQGRLKPMSRLRKNMEEIEKEKSGDMELRLGDWYRDIKTGYSG